jgi:2-phosphosulfolactate phosphatase
MPARHLNVHFLPKLIPPRAMFGSAVVVIDVLRASTTIAAALAAGASEILPCLSVDDARHRATGSNTEGDESESPPLLGGERGGERIEGFDLGNSPAEYTAERVAGRRIVFTTTNGTKALLASRDATRIVIGSFVNAAAVVAALSEDEKIDLVCAGTDGEVTAEDVLLAGMLADRLAIQDTALVLSDQAILAQTGWQNTAAAIEADPPRTTLLDALRQSTGGKNLTALALDADIEYAAEVDRHNIVPQYDAESGKIRANP